MPRRRAQRLERVLGTPALFATAYGNVGSSIYYALGLTAAYALGLTPVVFIIAGLIFACTAASYTEGTVRYPEAGGSSSFARHAFNETVSFGAGWAQMLVYITTTATSAFFVPHYLSIFAIYFTLPSIALSAMPVKKVGGKYQTLLGLSPKKSGSEIIVLGATRRSERMRRDIFGSTLLVG